MTIYNPNIICLQETLLKETGNDTEPITKQTDQQETTNLLVVHQL